MRGDIWATAVCHWMPFQFNVVVEIVLVAHVAVAVAADVVILFNHF